MILSGAHLMKGVFFSLSERIYFYIYPRHEAT